MPNCDACGGNLISEFRVTFNPYEMFYHCEKCGRTHHFSKDVARGKFRYHTSYMTGHPDTIFTTCSNGHLAKPDAAEIFKSPRGYTMIECHKCGERMIFK